MVGIDNDVKAKFNQYNSVKTNLAASQRRQTYAPRFLSSLSRAQAEKPLLDTQILGSIELTELI